MALLGSSAALLWVGYCYKPRSCEDYRIIYNIIGIVLGISCLAAAMIVIIDEIF
jgi:hypothetical protein